MFLVQVSFSLTNGPSKQMLKLRGRGFVEYHGSMTASKREKAVETFEQQDDIRIMLISNVGSAGLNLTAASVVIFLVSHPSVVWLS